jgi:hypothetical protein
MKTRLIQKNKFSKKEFILDDKFLHIKTVDIREKKEYSLKLDSIGNQVSYMTENLIIKKIVVPIFFLIPVICIVSYLIDNQSMDIGILFFNIILWNIMALFFLLKPGKKETYIAGGHNMITFYQDLPSKDEVDNFVNKVIKKSNNYVRLKYMKVDPDVPEETQMGIYQWLLNSEFITDEEYESLKNKYRTQKLL